MKHATTSMQRLICAALTAGLASLWGCGGGGSDAPAPVDDRIKATLSGFDNQTCMEWSSYGASVGAYVPTPLQVRLDADGSPYAVSTGPWWTDLNHVVNGSNYVNIVAVTYYEGWIDPTFGLSAVSPGRPLDLRNADLTLQWRAPTLLMRPESKLVFWFQTRAFDPAVQQLRYVNYALTGQTLVPRPGDTNWQEVTLKLAPNASQWSCLGSSPTRTDTYGCARSIDEALSNFEADMGFLIVSPDQATTDQPSGAVEFKSISMMLPPENASTHDNTVSYLATGRTACTL